MRFLFIPSLFVMTALSIPSAANAGSITINDPLYKFNAFEVNIGVGNVLNTLDGPFFAVNNTSPGAFAGPLVPLLDTDILDLGIAGRAAVKFSHPIAENMRLFIEGEFSSSSESSIFTPAAAGTYPGSYDDGFLVPLGAFAAQTIDTETIQFKLGQEWATSNNWRFRAAVQLGRVSQDFEGGLFDAGGVFGRTLTTNSSNTQLGVSVGTSYYSALGASTGLRLSADLGVYRNDFDYDYTNINAAGFLDQSNSASDISISATTKFSATLEKTLSNNSLVSFGVGLENFHNVGSGLQTFLNPQGTATTAAISKDTISIIFINLGYTQVF